MEKLRLSLKQKWFNNKKTVMTKLKDDSIMTFGKYKGYTLENMPANYLIWLYENNKCFGPLKVYIVDNLDFLRMEAKE